MATEEITISELELASEVLPDMTIPVDTATETRATTLGAIKEWIDVDGAILTALPIGVVLPFAANTAPTGFLLCNGAKVSRTTYADLFAVIGTTYGTGDGSTTFALPNLIDKFIQGSGTAGTVKAAGLPNITGEAGYGSASTNGFYSGTSGYASGAFKIGGSASSKASGGGDNNARRLGFDASGSNSIYGNSSTVQPPALTMRYYIKY